MASKSFDYQTSTSGFQKAGDILEKSPLNNSPNVNNVDKDISNNVKNAETNKENGEEKKETTDSITNGILDLLKEFSDEKAKNKWLVELLEKRLDDYQNRAYYTKTVRENNPEILLRFLAQVEDAQRQGKIKKSKGAYFTWLVTNQHRLL